MIAGVLLPTPELSNTGGATGTRKAADSTNNFSRFVQRFFFSTFLPAKAVLAWLIRELL